MEHCVVYDNNTSSLNVILKGDNDDDNADEGDQGGFLQQQQEYEFGY